MRELLSSLIQIYLLCFFARMVLSWFPLQPGGLMANVAHFLRAITDPLLRPIQRVVPPVRAGAAAIDLSPMIVIFGLIIIQGALRGS
ncbi:MAG: YggT family protein [Acidimicrobiia bacterium]